MPARFPSLPLPVLDGMLAFEVLPTNPRELGVIAVTIDPDGLSALWVGERGSRVQCTWADLHALAEMIAAAEANLRDAADALACARAHERMAAEELLRTRGGTPISDAGNAHGEASP